MPTMEKHKVGTCKAKTNERWTRIVTTRELCSLQTHNNGGLLRVRRQTCAMTNLGPCVSSCLLVVDEARSWRKIKM